MKSGKLKNNFLHRLSLRESWVIFFILGIIMLNNPFLNIFNKQGLFFGFPLMFLYIIGGWALSILVIYLFTTSIKGENSKRNGAEHR